MTEKIIMVVICLPEKPEVVTTVTLPISNEALEEIRSFNNNLAKAACLSQIIDKYLT